MKGGAVGEGKPHFKKEKWCLNCNGAGKLTIKREAWRNFVECSCGWQSPDYFDRKSLVKDYIRRKP